jgi:anti-sigma factor ChrR (cupin superfamily)
MELNGDFDQRVVIDTAAFPWRPSPQPGIERKPLEHRGDAVTRATSIVRHAAGSAFPEDEIGLGMEFLVLGGACRDERGSHRIGTYVRSPPGSQHRPASPSGCELFLKVGQFQPDDQRRVVIDTLSAQWLPGLVPGLSVLPLHEHGGEHVALVRWAPGTRFQSHTHWGGEEILVLEGVFSDANGDYPAGTWLRSPHMSRHIPYSEPGCLIYVKVGHLA